jgi:hypothetical protein
MQSAAEFCKLEVLVYKVIPKLHLFMRPAADKTGTTLYRMGFDSVNLDSLKPSRFLSLPNRPYLLWFLFPAPHRVLRVG